MYTYKDLKEIIKSNGFKITYDASYLDRHCMSLNSELVQKYKIWVLATQKDLTEEINLDSVLKLSLNPISFTITGDLTSNDNIVKIKVNEWVELENKPFLLDIIKLIDGKRSISNILEYFDDVQKEDISILFDCLLKLSNYNLIEIMDKPKY